MFQGFGYFSRHLHHFLYKDSLSTFYVDLTEHRRPKARKKTLSHCCPGCGKCSGVFRPTEANSSDKAINSGIPRAGDLQQDLELAGISYKGAPDLSHLPLYDRV